MTLDQMRKLCLSFPGATEQIQWVDHLVFKVGGKVFLIGGFNPGNPYTIKAADESFHELTEHAGINPAPYLARARWIQIIPTECRLRQSELEALIRQSYELVFARLPKRMQKAVQEGRPTKPKARSRKRRARTKR